MGVLEQEQVVVDVGEQTSLQGQRVAIRDPTEPVDPEGPDAVGGGDQPTSASQSRVSMISRMRCRNAAA